MQNLAGRPDSMCKSAVCIQLSEEMKCQTIRLRRMVSRLSRNQLFGPALVSRYLLATTISASYPRWEVRTGLAKTVARREDHQLPWPCLRWQRQLQAVQGIGTLLLNQAASVTVNEVATKLQKLMFRQLLQRLTLQPTPKHPVFSQHCRCYPQRSQYRQQNRLRR